MNTQSFSSYVAVFSCLLFLSCDDSSKSDKEAPKQAPVEAKAEPEPEPETEPEPEPEAADSKGATPTDANDEPGGDVDAPARPSLSFADAAAKAKAAELAKLRDGMEFPRELVSEVEHALPFLHLAHTEDDPGLVAASLYAVAKLFDSSPDDDTRMVDSDYHAVVAYRLASSDHAILTAAFEAAEHSVSTEPPDAKVVELLLGHANDGKSLVVRQLALDVLRHTKTWTGPIQSAFTGALEETSPEFLALALQAMEHDADDFVDREALITKLIGFTKHAHAGVRGQAVETLCGVRYDDEFRERVGKVIAPMLDDESAFVRAQAVYCAAVLRRLHLAGKIVTMLEDEGSAGLELDKWTTLDGAANRELLLTPSGGTVGSAGLMALSILSNETTEKFSSHEHVVRVGKHGKDLGPAIAAAKTWYAAHKSELDAPE